MGSAPPKTRKLRRHCPSVLGVVGEVVKSGGVGALWTGLAPSLVRIVPGAAIYFFTLQGLQNG